MWGYAIGDAFRSIRRNSLMSLASVSTVGLCLICLSIFFILSANLTNVAAVLESQVEIRVFLEPDANAQTVKRLEEIVSAYPEVSSVRYVSKDDALRALREQFGRYRELLEAVEDANPLPASFEIRLKDPKKVGDVARRVESLQGVDSVSFKQELVERLFRFTHGLRVAGAFLVAALSVATVVLVSNTIRITLYARRKEIAIMKLVGATDSFIKAPFMIEGLILGLLGAAIAACVSWAGYGWVVANVQRAMPFLPVVSHRPLVDRLAIALFTAGPVMGALGSSISIKRYMRV